MKINSVIPPAVPTAGANFARVPRADINRSIFDRSHGHKTSFDAGYLVPIFRDIAFPGDTFNIHTKVLARIATPIKPFMDRITFDVHVWAVPLRLLWEHWANFMGERKPNPSSSISYVTPKLDLDGLTVTPQSVYDYMGFRQRAFTATDDDRYHSLYMRAYNTIWNEQYRDGNLQNSVAQPLGDGPDAHAAFALLRRGKRHDYFTSGLTAPQKGNAVTIPLGTFAPVVSTGVAIKMAAPGGGADRDLRIEPLATNDATFSGAMAGVVTPMGFGSVTGLQTDLSAATVATINALRIGIATQHILERDARSGTRLTEIIQAHFGVTSPDSRMQRPELLGTFAFDLNAVPVPMSNATAGGVPQGNLAAFGHAFSEGTVTQSFTEHCVVLALLSARAPYTYQQGHRRDMRYSTRYDFYLPDFANLGEQSILNDEIFSAGTAADNDTWGYQERWAEMRYMPSQVSGVMNSDAATSLDVWHLGQDFSALPPLNASFIVEDPPVDRVIAVPTEPHFLADIWVNFRAARPLPVFSVPGLDRI